MDHKTLKDFTIKDIKKKSEEMAAKYCDMELAYNKEVKDKAKVDHVSQIKDMKELFIYARHTKKMNNEARAGKR